MLFDGEGREARARIETSSRRCVEARVTEVRGPAPGPALRISLAQGIARGERMDYALQKAVELGAHALVPVFTERCVVRLDGERLARRMTHWQGVVVAACEQAHRSRLPRLESARGLGDCLARAQGPGVLLDPGADTTLAELAPPGERLALLVGPEGGLSEAEMALAEDRGFHRVRLGPRVLRTETAPVAALAAIQSLWGDFR